MYYYVNYQIKLLITVTNIYHMWKMSLEKLKNGLSQYVLHSNYNTSFGDLVPVIVANAIHLNVIILMKSGMNFTVHGICIDQC